MSTNKQVKVTAKGTELPLLSLKGKPYLQVAHRLVWFREEHPTGSIATELVSQTATNCVAKATVTIDGKIIATGFKQESVDNFPDFIEKAETGAIGRALAVAGFGTQFEPALDEQERIVDSPVPSPKGLKVALPTVSVTAQKIVEGIASASNIPTEIQIRELIQKTAKIVIRQERLTPDQLRAGLKEKFGVEKTEALTVDKLPEVKQWLESVLSAPAS